MRTLRTLSVALLAAGLWQSPLACAQQNPGYFIPPSARPQQPRSNPRPQRPQRRPTPAPAPSVSPAIPPIVPGPQADADQQPPRQIQLPPVPDLPALPKGVTPPAAVVGVLGVPDVMRASKAAQQVERIIGERREKLNQDATKEQATWRELQQQLATQRTGLSADQIRTRERELQERITNAQRTFQNRNKIIQESAQYSLAQIERTLIAVIRQVSESRGMNLVLHRSQVALNVNEFDITEQVVEQINKVMPQVSIPPDGVSPSTIAQPASPASPQAQPASQPATPGASPAPNPAPGTPAPPPATPRR